MTNEVMDLSRFKTFNAIEPSSTCSKRYSFFGLQALNQWMNDKDYYCTGYSEVKSRKESRIGKGKVLLRYRHKSLLHLNDGEVFEIIVLTAHDGSSSVWLFGGFFRGCCANGIMVGNTINRVRLRHVNLTPEMVYNAITKIVNQAEKAKKVVLQMKETTVTPATIDSFLNTAFEVLNLKDKDITTSTVTYMKHYLNRVRRIDDDNGSMWTLFNRVQENLLRGGIPYSYYVRDENNIESMKRATTRQVRSIDRKVNINRTIWDKAESLLQVT